MKTFINPAAESWEELCRRPAQDNEAIRETVAGIISDIRSRGDEAIRDLSQKIDGIILENLLVSEDEFVRADVATPVEVKKAIARAVGNICAFHEAQKPSAVEVETARGVRCFQKPVPISSVGLYIPGGTAPLFSTVLMLAVPARVAGCDNIILCTPPSRETGEIAPAVLCAARMCGVDRVFKVGGAQAIAAMAYGTASIPRVNKIFGPGNRYVTMAKQMLAGDQVAIDMPAGPSEVMVMADAGANPEFVAADLLSQAEHGADSQVMLLCDSTSLAEKCIAEVERQSAVLDRSVFALKALEKSRAIVFEGPDSRTLMTAFANAYASEHLIISMERPWEIAEGITEAGSVFIGSYSPESAGDYASGTNHTLPTSGWARAFSGVNIDSYLRKITYQELSREGLEGLGETIVTMAEAEGLQAHANAVKVRLK